MNKVVDGEWLDGVRVVRRLVGVAQRGGGAIRGSSSEGEVMVEEVPLQVKQELRHATLADAARLVSNERATEYGDARESFEKIALHWSVIVGADVTADMVARMMIALKLVRLDNTPTHHDSWVDVAGYAALGREVADVIR